MKKIISLILCAVLVVGVFAFAGCSKDDSNTNDPAAETPATKVISINLTEEEYAFGVDKAQPELLEKANTFIAQIMKDGTFDEICNRYFGDGTPVAVTSAKRDSSKEQLVVATNAAFAPFEYMEGDKYFGVDMEIAKLFADYLGQELVIENMKFEAVCLSVGQHQCDIAMAGLTITEERKAEVTFTDSYYKASQQIIVRGNDTTFDACKTADEVIAILNSYNKDKIVGVQQGTTGMYYVQGDEGWDFDGLPTDCKTYEAGSLAVQDMINGNIDMVIIDAAPAAKIVESINAVA